MGQHSGSNDSQTGPVPVGSGGGDSSTPTVVALEAPEAESATITLGAPSR